MDLHGFLHLRKKMSAHRKNLFVLTCEGIPAIVVLQLLGGPFLTGFLLYLGARPEQIGIAIAIPTLANVLQIPMAFLMQKLENRRLILLMGGGLHRLLWTSTGLIPFVLPRDGWIPAFFVLYGSAFAANAVGAMAWTSLVGDMVPLRVRGRYLGFRNMVLWAVGSAAIFVGGLLLDRMPDGSGFQAIFAICGVCSILNIVAFWFYPNPRLEKSKFGNGWGMLLSPFRDKMFLRAMVFLSVWLFVQGVIVPLFPYIMLDLLKINYQWVSIFTMVQTISMMISYYFWGILNAKYASRTLLLWVLPLIAASCILWAGLAALPPIPVLLAVFALLGIGTGGYNQMVFNFTISDTPKSERPMYIAVFSAMTGVAACLGPFAGGYLYEWMSGLPEWMAIYGISTAIGLLLATLSITVAPFVFKVGRYVETLRSGNAGK